MRPASLPFNVVDEVVHLLDSPSEPWSIELELELAGRLDDGRLRAAVGAALARHPMARARMAPARRSDREYRWQITERPDLDPLRLVEGGDEESLDGARAELHSLGVPLAESPPLRLRRIRGPHGDSLALNVNHAAFDGFGALRLLHSVARAYAGRDDPGYATDLDQARDVRAVVETHDRRARAERFRLLADKVRDVLDAPCRVAGDGGEDRAGYGLVHRALSAVETAALSVEGHPATVNDLLVAALHRTIAGWNADHGAPCRRVSVLMPVNLRPPAWRQDVVTNMVLMTRISSRRRDRDDDATLLEAVCAQSRRIKRWGTGAALVEVLRALPRLPLWAKQSLSPLLALTGNRLVDTAVLTNLGHLDEAPDFGGEAGPARAVWFSAPARMPCGLSVGAVTVEGALDLSFRYRHPLLGAAAAARLADRYLDDLARMAKDLAA